MSGDWRRALGALPARLYGVVMALRNRHFDRPANVWRAAIPVISVGNLTVGGTGKTPMVQWLCRALLDDGMRPAVLTRGYGGRAGPGPLWVSRGEGALCAAAEGGDEPVLLARSLPRVAIVAGSDRVAGARAAAADGWNCLVLDDGFQHRRVARDLDIVLVDAHDPFTGNRLLPAGDLREPPASLARADVVVLSGARPGDAAPPARVEVERWNARALVLTASRVGLGFVDRFGRSRPAPSRAVAFSGIARPERFHADLRAAGVDVVAHRSFTDHHRFRAAELRSLQELGRSHQVPVVTTEKDLARIESAEGEAFDPPLIALRIATEIHDPEPLRERLRGVVEGRR